MSDAFTTAALAQRRSMTVDGFQVSYLEWGDAENDLLIVLHSIIGPALAHEWLGVEYGTDFHVIAPDMLCRGHSDWADLPWPELEHERDAAAGDFDGTRVGHVISTIGALVDAHGNGRPAVLVGFSTGGVAAGVYASRHPERVRAVIIDDGPFLRSDPRGGEPLVPDRARLYRTVDGADARFAAVEDFFRPDGAGREPAVTTTGLDLFSYMSSTGNDPRASDAEWLRRRGEELLYQRPDGTWSLRPPRPDDTDYSLVTKASPTGIFRLISPEETKAIRVPTLVFHKGGGHSHWNDDTVAELRSLNPEWVRVVTVPAGPGDARGGTSVEWTFPHIWVLETRRFLAGVP